MIRFGLAGLAWLVCVGGVAFYMHARDAWREDHQAIAAAAPEAAVRRYDLELTLTFDAQPDPFALVTTESSAAPVVSVQLNGAPLVALSEGIAPGKPWLQENIQGVVEGNNELLVEATPPLTDEESRHALRLRVLSQGGAVADQTFWSQGGEKLVGVLPFEVKHHDEEDASGH
ncbi:MAG: hypothetical protein RBU21_11510 [FCB group bacterium]|jgi:hypothetical protein|nr:hypothetical protein [FCB group bacterium]